MWIQTDVSTSTINAGAYAGFGNNQMLCADPVSKETRRFLVGPGQCEITGVFVTPDQRTVFVGIQHPGERPDDLPGDPANPKQCSAWPDGFRRWSSSPRTTAARSAAESPQRRRKEKGRALRPFLLFRRAAGVPRARITSWAAIPG